MTQISPFYKPGTTPPPLLKGEPGGTPPENLKMFPIKLLILSLLDSYEGQIFALLGGNNFQIIVYSFWESIINDCFALGKFQAENINKQNIFISSFNTP